MFSPLKNGDWKERDSVCVVEMVMTSGWVRVGVNVGRYASDSRRVGEQRRCPFSKTKNAEMFVFDVII